MRVAAYLAGLAGLALFVALGVHADIAAVFAAAARAGPEVLWLLPYRASFFLLYALGWAALLRPWDLKGRLSTSYLFWAATVREGIDRLLPVASVGGALAGVRLLGWRGVATSAAAASVIVEVVLTLLAVWVFTALGLVLAGRIGIGTPAYWYWSAAAALLLPLGLVAALRSGAGVGAVERGLRGVLGLNGLSGGLVALDTALRATLAAGRGPALSLLLQVAALASGAFEVWLALRLFGHPVDAAPALILESLTQAARHLVFFVPAALGVQESALIGVGAAFGIGADLAFAVSLVKRLRELAWGLPALLSWHYAETRRLRLRLDST